MWFHGSAFGSLFLRHLPPPVQNMGSHFFGFTSGGTGGDGSGGIFGASEWKEDQCFQR